MIKSYSEYTKISSHFNDKTGKYCEFVQDATTMFLKVDGRLYKSQRNDTLTCEDAINIFERKINEQA